MLNIVLFGPPGAGKGTQSEKLIEKYHLTHLSTGDLFRMNITEKTEMGLLAQKFMDDGNLVPDEVVIGMVADKIKNTPDAVGFIFDGFPRTVKQAEALDDLMNDNGTPIVTMLSLSVEEEELLARLINRGKDSGRPDDQNIDKIKNRFTVYKRETAPVADFYGSQGKLINIEGVGGIEAIFGRLCDAIDAKV
ncbi:MAG: adenylate kinase [Bacteroidota bacterium]